MITRFLLIATTITNFFYIQMTSLNAGVNSSVVVSILGATSLFTAAAFFITFKEHLKKKHLIGMILMVTSVSLIASGSNTDEKGINV
jgi:drug/metabolite transporter (DMT)-like permease